MPNSGESYEIAMPNFGESYEIASYEIAMPNFRVISSNLTIPDERSKAVA